MGYANLLLHLQLGISNAALLAFTQQLAAACQARVTGFAARQPMKVIYAESYVPETLVERDRAEIAAEFGSAKMEFRSVFGSDADWRSAVTYDSLAGVLAREARCADLVITGIDHETSVFDDTRHLDVGELVMQAGRPCLIVPQNLRALALDHVVVGWKDTTETRRAVCSALPVLKLAKRVTVIELACSNELDEAQDRVADVHAWLLGHGIDARASVEALVDDTSQLRNLLANTHADLIVAGVYGHSRTREWILGGVTRDLLLSGDRCALVSH
ncbi:MAG: universal stress protein [Rhodospirillales bacterium]|nr:universal stress protein [Acetobacter sp.]